jgi:hypothetical protein
MRDPAISVDEDQPDPPQEYDWQEELANDPAYPEWVEYVARVNRSEEEKASVR